MSIDSAAKRGRTTFDGSCIGRSTRLRFKVRVDASALVALKISADSSEHDSHFEDVSDPSSLERDMLALGLHRRRDGARKMDRDCYLLSKSVVQTL